MIPAIAAFLMKTGLERIDAFKWAKRVFIGLIIVCTIFTILFFGWLFNACQTETKFDEENLQKINSNIDKERDAEIEKLLVENELIEQSVNQRTEESEQRLKLAEEKVRKAREFNKNITAEELRQILKDTE